MSSQKKKKKNRNRNGGGSAQKHIEAKKTTAAASADRTGKAEDTGAVAGKTEPEAAKTAEVKTEAAEIKPETAEAEKAAEIKPETAEAEKAAEIKPETAEAAKAAEIKPETAESDKSAEIKPEAAETDKSAEIKPEAAENTKAAEVKSEGVESAKTADIKPEDTEDTKAAEIKPETAEADKPAEDSSESGEAIKPETAGNTTLEAEIKKEHADPEADEPESGGNESKEKKGIRGAKKAVLIVAVVLLVLLLLLVGACFVIKKYINERFLNKINYETTGESLTVIENIPTQTEETLPEQQTIDNLDEVEKGLVQADAKTFFQNGESAEANYITNILLIGSDVRPGKDWNGNSDAMILVSINNRTKKVVMTSFMRDMYVYIPVIDTCSKLNAAHAYGGSELLCQTITGAFKIKVDKYIRVDFYGLMDIIDAAGGVDMLVTEEELPVLNKYITDMCRESGTGMIPDGLYLDQAGNVHLTGMQAVAYARIRYVGNSDFERTNRQRKVMGELVNNCKKMNISQLTRLADVALPRVSTNMSRDEIWDMVNDAVKYMGYEVEMQRVPFDGTFTAEYINYQQVILPDYVENVELMIKGIYGE